MREAQGMSRRRFLQGTGALSVLAVAGCGSSSTGSSSLQVADYSYQQTGYKQAMDGVTAKFVSQNAKAKVEQVAAPVSQYASTVLTQLQAGSPPDVIRVDDPQMSTYIANGWLEPLDDVVSRAGLTRNDLVPSESDAVANGKLYGIVKESNPRIFIYNKALYENAGVGAPTDLQSLEDAIRRTTDSSKGQFGTAFDSKQGDPTTLFIQLTPLIYGIGGSIFTNGRPTANDPKTVQAIEFIQKLWVDNLVPRGLDAVTVNNLVIQGKVAATINGAFVFIEGKQSNPSVAANLTAIKNPLSGKNMRATAWWAIPSKAKHPDLAKAYLTALLDKTVQQNFNEDAGVIVARKDGISPKLLSDNPWFQIVVDESVQNSTASYFPQSLGPKGSAAVTAAGTALLNLLYNGGDASKAMNSLQSQLESTVA